MTNAVPIVAGGVQTSTVVAGHRAQPAGASPAITPEPLSTGMWVSYVCYDIEATGGSRSVHDLCQLVAALFWIQKPDGESYINLDGRYCEYVRPANDRVWDSRLAGTGTHIIIPADVAGAQTYPSAIAALCEWVRVRSVAAIEHSKGTQMSQLERDSWTVCLVAHNGKSTDFDWTYHLNERYGVSLPPYIVRCWDTLPAIKLHPQFKVAMDMVKNGAWSRAD